MAVSIQPAWQSQSSPDYTGINNDTQAANQVGNRFGASTGGVGDRSVSQGENLTAEGSSQFFNTLNEFDPTGAGGFAGFSKALQDTTAVLQPESTIDKMWQGLALASTVGALSAGAGAMVGGAAGLGLGTTAGGIASGATGGAASSILTTGGQNLAQDTLIGGALGGLGAGLGPSGLGLPSPVSGALTGGVRSELTGGNPLTGALAGAGSGLGGELGVPGASAVGGYLGGMLGNTISGPQQSPGGQQNTMMNSGGNPSYQSYANPLASMFSGLGSLVSPIMSGIGANNQGSMQNNAYTTAGNAANSGMTFGSTGLGGMGAQWANGQLNMNPGAMGGAAGMFSQFANQQGGMANQFGSGYMPGNVTSAFNQFNNQIGQGLNFTGQGQNTAGGVMGMGANMLNSANANQQQAYQTSLQSAQAALNPQIQQQSNALLNSNFEKGMSGTSGGALQTQALQNSFNTANLQAQNQAVGQGLNAFNSTINAGTGMFNSGAGQLGNFNNQALNFGNTGLQGSYGYNMFSPQIAGAYQQNANQGVAGFSGINNSMLGNFQAGLGAITNQGTQQNRGAMTQVSGANTYNGGLPSYLGGVLGSPGATSNLIGGASNLFNGLTGGLSSMFGGAGAMNPGGLSGQNGTAGLFNNTDLNNIYSGNFTPTMNPAPSYNQYTTPGYS